MADNRITAWLRLKDRLRFSREARRAAKDIREINKAADESSGPFEKLSGFISTLGEQTASLTPRTRIFGFAIGTVATAAVAAIPLIVGLGGAITAVVGSMASAAIGAALLAGALTAVLGVGFGALGIAVFDFAKNFGTVDTAFQNWKRQVSSFGRDSQQAQTAFSRLIGTIAQNGGPAVFDAVQKFQELRNVFEKEMAPATEKVMGFVSRLFDTLVTFMPTLARWVGIVVNALLPVFQSWADLLFSNKIQRGLGQIFDAFAQIAGPIGQGVGLIFSGLMTLVTRMLPNLGPVASGFTDIAGAFNTWANTADLSPFLASLQSWWDLLKAIGGLLVTILTGGAKEGDSLVDTLTGVINGWNEILKTPSGRAGLVSFFKDSIDMTKQFAAVIGGVIGFLFRFGRTLVPVYTGFFKLLTDGWKAVMDALAPAKPFWDNVLAPLLKGLAIGVGGTLFGAFKVLLGIVKIVMSALGFLGKLIGPGLKPLFETIGKVIGFVAGGPILKLLSGIGKISILLRPLGFLFRLLYAPVAAVGRIFGWLFGKLGRIAGAFAGLAGRFIPGLRSAWNAVLGWLTGAGLGGRLFDAGAKLWGMLRDGFLQAIGTGLGLAGDAGKAIYNGIAGLINTVLPNKIPVPGLPDIPLPDNPIPLLGAGGVITGVGSWVTGEAGPELNTMTQSGHVVVQPLTPAIQAHQGQTSLPNESRTVVSKVFLRGRQIAEAVAEDAEDDSARRGRRR